MYLAPVGSHLLAVLSAGVEAGYLVGSEDVVHVLGEEVLCSGEDHSLLLEVLDMGALGEELWHVVYAMTCFMRLRSCVPSSSVGTWSCRKAMSMSAIESL